MRLVKMFLDEYFPRAVTKENLLHVFADFVSEFGWDAAGALLIGAIEAQVYKNRTRLP